MDGTQRGHNLANVKRIGSLFLSATFLMSQSSCSMSGDNQQGTGTNALEQNAQNKGLVRVIEEVSPGEYKIVEEYPSNVNEGPNVIVKSLDGTSKVYTESDLRDISNKEELQQGSTHPGLAGVLFAGVVGAMIGGMAAKWASRSNPGMYKDDKAYQQSQRTSTVFSSRFPSGGGHTAPSGTPSGAPSNQQSGFFSSKSGGSADSSGSFGA